NPPSLSLWTRLGFYADAADTFWQDWVVSYDLGRQLVLADRMEQSSRRFRLDWLDWATVPAMRWESQTRAWLQRHAQQAVLGSAIAGQFVTAYQELRFGGKAEAAPKLFLLLEELKRQG